MSNLDVYYVYPSCNAERHNETVERWRKQGYKVGVLTNGPMIMDVDFSIWEPVYQGYWKSVNMLCKALVERADVIVVGADDIHPDPNLTAQEIAGQFLEHFPGGYGVMQPTGDDLDGTDRICGSPWLGSAWIREGYHGEGPYWGGYGHYYADEEMFEVARDRRVLWQRDDLTQYHDHWIRKGADAKTDYQIYNNGYWDQDKELFRDRRAKNFPGSNRI